MSLTLPSFAKINWTLEILGKRADGYHELRTLLQTIDLADRLSFTPIERGIEIVCDHPDVPQDESNLAYRAAASLADFAGVSRGVRIEIDKRIPAGAGLGGGSSNAAVTLTALRRLWKVDITIRDLFALGSKLGADVPFFFTGGTSIGVGRGDEVYPVADIKEDFLLLVNAGIVVPTGEAYAALPAELTNPGAIVKMPLSLVTAYAGIPMQSEQSEIVSAGLNKPDKPEASLQNDLETTVFALHPLLGEIKKRLADSGARGVLMSGSGSTIFAIFDTQEARHGAQRNLSETGWWCVPTRTLSRQEFLHHYRPSMAR